MDSKIKKSTNKIIPPHLDCFNNNNLILSKNQLFGCHSHSHSQKSVRRINYLIFPKMIISRTYEKIIVSKIQESNFFLII